MLLLNPIGLRPWSSARCFDTRTPCLASGDVTACVQSHEKVRSQEAFGPPAEISELTEKKGERNEWEEKGALQEGAEDWHLFRISVSLIFFCVIADRKERLTDERIAASE